MTNSSPANVLVHSPDGVEKRRGTRLLIEVPITVMGMDTLGEPFKESATTISVSCYGCKYRSRRYAPKDAVVTVEIRQQQMPKASRVEHARVVWVQRPRHHRETFQIGLELETPGNVWGIDAPPADWFPPPEELPHSGAVEPAAQAQSPETTSPSHSIAPPSPAPAFQPEPAAQWETLDVPPGPTLLSASASGSDVSSADRDFVKETVRATSDAIVAEEVALIRKHFTGRLESALLETLKTFSELSVEIVKETREACRASAKQMEAELQRIAREVAAHAEVPGERPARNTPQSKRRRKIQDNGPAKNS